MRNKIVAGNWKMNKTLSEAKILIKELKQEIKGFKLNNNTRVIIAPSYVNLQHAVKKTKNNNIEVAAQNIHQANKGAFTGEISAEMLLDVGIKTTILGHSERRQYFGEVNDSLKQKVDTALEHELEIIFCVGEKLEEREANNHFNVIETQIKEALFHLDTAAFKQIVIAYEPVWAIGTGKTASAEQAQEMHAFIRSLINTKYNTETAEAISILYGGSVKPANAAEIFSKPDVDGGLIGGAALNAKDFSQIIKAI